MSVLSNLHVVTRRGAGSGCRLCKRVWKEGAAKGCTDQAEGALSTNASRCAEVSGASAAWWVEDRWRPACEVVVVRVEVSELPTSNRPGAAACVAAASNKPASKRATRIGFTFACCVRHALADFCHRGWTLWFGECRGNGIEQERSLESKLPTDMILVTLPDHSGLSARDAHFRRYSRFAAAATEAR